MHWTYFHNDQSISCYINRYKLVELLTDKKIKTEMNEDEKTPSSTKTSQDKKILSSNLIENEKSISNELLSVEDTQLMKYETLHLFNKFDFVWPGAIERLKVANIRKK